MENYLGLFEREPSDEQVLRSLHLALNNNESIEIINLILDNSTTETYAKADEDEDEDNEEYPTVLYIEDDNGMLPFHHAIINECSIDIIQILLEKFPNAVLHQDNDGLTPLHHFLKNKKIHEQHRPINENDIDIIDNKIQNIIEIINSILNKSTTAFDYKFYEAYPSILNIKDKDGFIPLHCAIMNNCSFEVIDLLIDSFTGSFFAKTNNGLTIYHIDIIYNKSTENALYISDSRLYTNPDVDQEIMNLSECVDNEGKTYFHYLIEYNLPIQSIYEILYRNNITVLDIKDNNGLLPLDYARNNKSSQDIIDLLAANTCLDYSNDNLSLFNALRNKESDNKIIDLINIESVKTFDNISGGETNGSPLVCALENKYPLHIIERLVERFPESIMGIRVYFCSDTVCHTALYVDCSNDILSFILKKYPILCSIEDAEGKLPIHIALDGKYNSSLENIKLLLEIHPIINGDNFLHNAYNNTLEIFEFVLNKYPDSVKYKNSGDLPIHIIYITDVNIFKKIKLLLKKYPEGSKEKNEKGRLPLEIYARKYRNAEMNNYQNLQEILSHKYKVLHLLYEANPSEEARNCLTENELIECDKIRTRSIKIAINDKNQPLTKNDILTGDIFGHITSFV